MNNLLSEISNAEEILTVNELNNAAKKLLENHMYSVIVEGEISNFLKASSGHCYFSLKDSKAQIKCAMFKGAGINLNFAIENGLKVIAKGKVSIYEPRGDFQLIISYLYNSGLGLLHERYEKLKKELAEAGYFAEENKKILPKFINKIGVVTSPDGAAIRDIIITAKRRYPLVEIILYPTLVQGKNAANKIVKAIEIANFRKEVDILIVGRGGGSLEDLWSFNEEIVAKAIYKSEIPIVAAVGHEIDFTIADFVADKRAATPTAAAELVTQDKAQLLKQLINYQKKLLEIIKQDFRALYEKIIWLKKLCQHPKTKLELKAQRLDELRNRINKALLLAMINHQNKLNSLKTSCIYLNPIGKITSYKTITLNFSINLQRAVHKILSDKRQILKNLLVNLEAVSPLATLKRGYAIVHKENKSQPITSNKQIIKGEELIINFYQGKLLCLVKEKID